MSAHAKARARQADLRKAFDSRPLGDLESVTSKVEYVTFEGKKTVYLTVSFIKATGMLDGSLVVIERPFEFFMPAGQRNAGQQWITSAMRLLSLVARSGGSVAKAIADMREVVWDRGLVRCGTITKQDGGSAPLFHDSEVAALGYSMQQILRRRGFIDAEGNQVPARVLAQRQTKQQNEAPTDIAGYDDGKSVVVNNSDLISDQKCPEYGAHALHKRDGCQHCSSCGYVGNCG